MDAATRQLVRQRSGNRCEYCRLPQHAVDATFHVEHVIARQHAYDDELTNLALACDRCNLYKGPNLISIDPETNSIVPLFNPRKQNWKEHFAMEDAEIVGLTSTGRATVRLLNMNARHRVHLRAVRLENGTWEEP